MFTFAKTRNLLTGTGAALLFAVVFMAFLTQPMTAYAASGDTVGVVDPLYLINNHPDTPKANEALRAEQEKAKQEFETKAASLSDKEKQDLNNQLMKQIEEKRQELLKPIVEKVSAVVREVADSKGLSVVINKASAVYGGVDITEEVMNKINGK